MPASKPRCIPVRTVLIDVAGVSYPNTDGISRQRWIELFARPGAKVELVLEENEHGVNGAAVCVIAGKRQIGYAPNNQVSYVGAYLREEFSWTGRVLQIHPSREKNGCYGVFIECAFWKNTPRPSDPYREGYFNNIENRKAAGKEPWPDDVTGYERKTEIAESSHLLLKLGVTLLLTAAAFAIAHRRHTH